MFVGLCVLSVFRFEKGRIAVLQVCERVDYPVVYVFQSLVISVIMFEFFIFFSLRCLVAIQYLLLLLSENLLWCINFDAFVTQTLKAKKAK